MESLQGERSERFLRPFVQESRQMAYPALTKAFLQAAATATMHCQAERCTHQLQNLHQHVHQLQDLHLPARIVNRITMVNITLYFKWLLLLHICHGGAYQRKMHFSNQPFTTRGKMRIISKTFLALAKVSPLMVFRLNFAFSVGTLCIFVP